MGAGAMTEKVMLRKFQRLAFTRLYRLKPIVYGKWIGADHLDQWCPDGGAMFPFRTATLLVTG